MCVAKVLTREQDIQSEEGRERVGVREKEMEEQEATHNVG